MTIEKPRPLIELQFCGATVREGKILFDDLASFVFNFRLAIERTIDVLEIGTSFRQGRPPSVLHSWSALEIISTGKGSFKVTLGLRRDVATLPPFDAGLRAIEELVNGLPNMSEDNPLPKTVDQGVLMALRDAGSVLDRGIDTIGITFRNGTTPLEAKYVRATREYIVTNIRKLEQAWTVIEGRLLMADVKENSLYCRIYPSTGGSILCKFDEPLVMQVVSNLRHFVQARGEATFDPTTNVIRYVHVKDLESIEEPRDTQIVPAPLSAFWESKTFEELASEQGIYPIENWNQLRGNWPEDTDFDSFLEAVRSSRDN